MGVSVIAFGNIEVGPFELTLHAKLTLTGIVPEERGGTATSNGQRVATYASLRLQLWRCYFVPQAAPACSGAARPFGHGEIEVDSGD
ncbi:hypothetical protein ACJ7K1_30965 [Paenibacillus elgii]